MNVYRIRLPMVWIVLMVAICCAPILPAQAVKTEIDQIGITATMSKDATGKTLIRAELFNGSQFPICATNLQTGSGAFHFKLLDLAKNEILPDPEWANEFAQKSARRYHYPRSARVDLVEPGKKTQFEFYLEDAYKSRSPEGVSMDISWESYYPDPTPISSKEKYMFPERWAISVNLPLKQNAEKKSEKIKVFDATNQSSEIDAGESPNSKFIIDSNKKVTSESKNQLWWFLLIPLILLILYVSLCKKSSS